MLYQLYQFVHNSLGICFWDLPALFIGVIMIIVVVGHRHKQKKREKDFEKDLEEKIQEIRETEENEEVFSE